MAKTINETKETYEFINMTLWWFKIPEVIATVVALVGGAAAILGILPIEYFFCGFWMRIIMVPLRLIFVNWKRNLEKEHQSLTRMKFSMLDSYKNFLKPFEKRV
jgi:hypothetical protein